MFTDLCGIVKHTNDELSHCADEMHLYLSSSLAHLHRSQQFYQTYTVDIWYFQVEYGNMNVKLHRLNPESDFNIQTTFNLKCHMVCTLFHIIL